MTHNGKTPGGITGKGFVPGDPRCNRKGRPKGFDQLRRVAQQIVGEDVVWADGRTISRVELILRRWARSKNPRAQLLFMEYAFGPVPTKIETNTLVPGTRLILRWPHEDPEHPNYKPPGKGSWLARHDPAALPPSPQGNGAMAHLVDETLPC